MLGKDVVGIAGDSGDTTTDQANQTADRMLAQNVDAIIGTASSSVTLTIIDKIAGAGVTMFSPANTSTELTDYPDKGLYFRTAPPDIYQGDVLGQFVVNDGNQTVAIIRRNDSYGTSLGAAAAKTIANSGARSSYDTAYETDGDGLRRLRRRDRRRRSRCDHRDRLRRVLADPAQPRREGHRSSTTSTSTAPTATSATPSASTSTPATDVDVDTLN